MQELKIRAAGTDEFAAVRSFYHTLIDQMRDAPYKPGWAKGVYPSDAYLLDALQKRTLYLGELAGGPVAAMIVNHDCNDGYRGVQWRTDASAGEVSVIHALGVLPSHGRRGLAGRMVREVISSARQAGQRAVRLDVLAGNLPAERLYTRIGFCHAATVRMFYEDTGWTDFLLYEYPL